MDRRRPPKFKVLYVLVLGLLLICSGVLIAPRPKTISRPRLPDMSDCTRIEVLFESSAWEYLNHSTDDYPLIFNPKETEYLRSIKKIVCNDKRTIAAYTSDLGNGIYSEFGLGRVSLDTRVVAYRDDEEILSFKFYDGAPLDSEGALLTESGDCYDFQAGFPAFPAVVEKQLGPYLMRSYCETKLWVLGWRGFEAFGPGGFPEPSEWCDAITRRMQRDWYRIGVRPTKPQKSVFECPGAKTCHFAMNTHCTANSPSSTVLLFESKPGWNQHGGPELFTMDNHEPKGGLVLLKDETRMFVRSHEALNKLRWK
jgi:hypothetical protein